MRYEIRLFYDESVKKVKAEQGAEAAETVSYTHLTLPTILLV